VAETPVSPAILAARLEVVRCELPGVVVRTRRMRRGLVTARRIAGTVHLTLHPDVVFSPDCSVFLRPWVAHGGRHGTAQRLREYLGGILRRRTCAAVERDHAFLAGLETIGSQPDLQILAEFVRSTWFPTLPPIHQVGWSRHPPHRRLRHLRFGCYRRGAQPRIEVSPRLARPWVARCFLLHVLHHEFCHHRQAVEGRARGEGVHSPRFRAWEHGFPDYADAIRWEKLALPWLLDDQAPPWYGQARSTP